MNELQPYPIGVPGEPWGAAEIAAWRALQRVKRSYADEVVASLQALHGRFEVGRYGLLEYSGRDYPLYVVTSRQWSPDKPVALVTGGVHGYETSGVHGAIRFLQQRAEDYSRQFNIIVMPCISPWGYETINRWNPEAVDPNRSFCADSPAAESAAAMEYLSTVTGDIVIHVDLHETTDTDNSEFRPALAARDAIEQKNWNIPDGFYLVGDSERPVEDFQAAVIARVEQVTHIAPADDAGTLIGVPLSQPGVINYPVRTLGLCAGVTAAPYRTTTEVYPDSPLVDAENCILAQVAAVTGGLDYVAARLSG
jgi:hypothetical protein